MPTTNKVRLTLGLIERALRNPPPVGKTTFLRDSVVPGLALRIHPTGGATYTLLLPGGQRKKLLALQIEGREAPEWWNGHLKKVREQAASQMLPYRSLESLLHQRTAPARVQHRQADGSTKIERVIAEYTKRHLERECSLNHQRHSRGHFRRYVLPVWKNKDVRDITRKDVLDLLDDIADQGKPYAANRVQQLLSGMFNWAISRELLKENSPVRGLRLHPEQPRERVLSDLELSLVWHAACAALPSPWSEWFKLLILMPNRRTELASMRWDAIDLNAATWTIEARQNKSRRTHLVPLSPLALQVLTGLPQTCPWVFTTTTAGPIKNYYRAKSRIDTWLAERVEIVAPWRIHDLRRTCATNLIKLHVAPHVVEATLNHKLTGIMFKHYAHHLHLFIDEKREALDKWADHVLALAERYQPAPTADEIAAEERRRETEELLRAAHRRMPANQRAAIAGWKKALPAHEMGSAAPAPGKSKGKPRARRAAESLSRP